MFKKFISFFFLHGPSLPILLTFPLFSLVASDIWIHWFHRHPLGDVHRKRNVLLPKDINRLHPKCHHYSIYSQIVCVPRMSSISCHIGPSDNPFLNRRSNRIPRDKFCTYFFLLYVNLMSSHDSNSNLMILQMFLLFSLTEFGGHDHGGNGDFKIE